MRIRFSRGLPDFPRDPTTLSGARLEYYGSAPTAFIGQWFSEFDSIELTETERVTEVRIWTVKRGLYPQRKVHVGPIVRITVSTSTGNTKNFQPADLPDTESCIMTVFRANVYEELVSRLDPCTLRHASH
jgi:hypothetical protein